MLLNKKAVKQYYHSKGKRIGKSALGSLEYKLKSVMDQSIRASNTAKTVEARDLDILVIKYNL
jgi:hypothetical protein